MNEKTSQLNQSVLIVGAPRSGTSLVHFMLKSCGKFWSLPSESDFIWRRYFVPKINDWQSDAIDPNRLNIKDIKIIRKAYRKYLSAPKFNAISTLSESNWSFNRYRRRASLAVGLYLTPFLSRVFFNSDKSSFVDKNTSLCGCLGAYEKVFPDVKLVYIVRAPDTNIKSINNAWQNAGRFESYQLPELLDLSDYHSRSWKFGLPDGWRSRQFSSTLEISAFQWLKYHQYFYSQITKPYWRQRSFVLHFEDILFDRTNALNKLSSFLNAGDTELAEKWKGVLPDVNRSNLSGLGREDNILGDLPVDLAESVRDLYSKVRLLKW